MRQLDRCVTQSEVRGNRYGRRLGARSFAGLIATAAAMCALGGVAAGTARADAANLLPNGTFEGTGTGSLAGWQGNTLSLATDGVGGGYAGKSSDASGAASYGLAASPNPVLATVANTVYSATGQVRSDTPGENVCLQVREVSATGALVASAQKCVTTTTAWVAFPTVSYGTRQTGDSIVYRIRQTTAGTTGASFEVDNLTLTATIPALPAVVALWHMDETSGTTMYDSVGSHNGTLTNGVTVGNPGFTGTSYGFNGSTSKSYVSVPDAADLNPGTSDFSFRIHVETSSLPTSGDYDVMRKGVYSATTSYQEYKMEIQQSGQASCAFRGTTGHAEVIAGPSVVDGQWHTIECSKTATAVSLIVDGVSFPKSVQIGSISNTSPLVMGAHPGSDYYKGFLDEASFTEG